MNLTNPIFDQEPITKDQYIALSQKLIKRMFQIHQESFVKQTNKEGDECYLCYGYGTFSQNGVYVDCPSCEGSGYQHTKVLDEHTFVEKIINLMYDSDENLIDLISTETI